MPDTALRPNGAALRSSSVTIRRERRRDLVTPEAVTDEDGREHAAKADRAFGSLFAADPMRVSLAITCEVYDGTALNARDVVLYVSIGTGTDPTRQDHDFLLNAGQAVLLSAAQHPEIRGEIRYRFVDNSEDDVLPAYVNAVAHTAVLAC